MNKKLTISLVLLFAFFMMVVSIVAGGSSSASKGSTTQLRAGSASIDSIVGTANVVSADLTNDIDKNKTESETNNDYQTEEVISTASGSRYAGVTSTINNMLLNASYIAAVTVADNMIEPVADIEYANVAIAQVDSFVYIRSIASTSGEVIGKLYNNSACQIINAEDGIDGDGRWYRITSGKCDGYVKAEFVVAGDAELAKSVSRRVATVNTDTLNIREGASMDAEIMGQLPNGDDLTVIDESIKDQGWVMVSCEKGDGYVATEYVVLSTSYTLAESKAEEEARLAREEAARKAAQAAAARKAAASKTGSKYNYTPANNGAGASYVINFASQFVGNPYVYGGTSLTNGADCSGFVMSVYANFGVSLPHSSAALRGVGYGVSYDNMQPGDIVCYSGHVGLYAGNGMLLHASTPESGIKYSSVNYREILAIRRIF